MLVDVAHASRGHDRRRPGRWPTRPVVASHTGRPRRRRQRPQPDRRAAPRDRRDRRARRHRVLADGLRRRRRGGDRPLDQLRDRRRRHRPRRPRLGLRRRGARCRSMRPAWSSSPTRCSTPASTTTTIAQGHGRQRPARCWRRAADDACRRPHSDQRRDERGRASRPVGLDRPIVDRPVDLRGDRLGDDLRAATRRSPCSGPAP